MEGDDTDWNLVKGRQKKNISYFFAVALFPGPSQTGKLEWAWDRGCFKHFDLIILTKHIMSTEVPEKGEYRVPARKKDQHGSGCVQAPEVVEQSLYQLKWYLLLTQLSHGVLRGEAVDRCVTGTIQRLLHNYNYIIVTSLPHISLEIFHHTAMYHLLSYKTTMAEHTIWID